MHPALLAKYLKEVLKEGSPLLDHLNIISLKYLALAHFQSQLNLKMQEYSKLVSRVKVLNKVKQSEKRLCSPHPYMSGKKEGSMFKQVKQDSTTPHTPSSQIK